MVRFYKVLPCLLLASAALCAVAQPLAAQDKSAPTFKTSARVVLVDAVVTDKQGRPVHGLKAQDFVLQEDGKPQQIRGFEERSTGTAKASPPLKLPPNTYTNYVDAQQEGAANILLFDTLNTDRANLAMARQQLLLYLSKMPPNTKVALYTLDSQLHLIHGFTQNPGELIELAKVLTTAPHPMFSNARQASDYAAAAMELITDPKMLQAVIQYIWGEQQGKEESRTIVTMEALAQLARSVAAVPGRKNLIWLAGGIPFDPASTAPQMQHVASLFAATQVAVYPIDVRGIPYTGTDALASRKQAFEPWGASMDDTGVKEEVSDVRETMMTLANLTGGKAHYNGNDLSAAIDDSIQSGSNYYLLAYRPVNNNWTGKFRKISVKATNPALVVHCRPGYYAVADPLGSPDIEHAFEVAMQPEVPVATTLIIKARVVPGEKTQIDTLVDMHDLSFAESDDRHRQPDVSFVAAVWDDKGKPAGSDTATYRQQLSPDQMESLMRTGLQLRQELPLKPGSYRLRIGVLDRISGKMGTLDIPLKVEASLSKEQTPQSAVRKP